MHRNTFVFIVFLAIFAAVVIGINLTKSPEVLQSPITPTPTILVSAPTLETYSNETCTFSFTYPNSYTRIDLENDGGAAFANKNNDSDTLTVFCQEDLPQPKELDTADEYTIGSISALLRQPVSSSSGNIAGRLFFTIPNTNLSVSIGGSPSIFQQVINTLEIQ